MFKQFPGPHGNEISEIAKSHSWKRLCLEIFSGFESESKCPPKQRAQWHLGSVSGTNSCCLASSASLRWRGGQAVCFLWESGEEECMGIDVWEHAQYPEYSGTAIVCMRHFDVARCRVCVSSVSWSQWSHLGTFRSETRLTWMLWLKQNHGTSIDIRSKWSEHRTACLLFMSSCSAYYHILGVDQSGQYPRKKTNLLITRWFSGWLVDLCMFHTVLHCEQWFKVKLFAISLGAWWIQPCHWHLGVDVPSLDACFRDATVWCDQIEAQLHFAILWHTVHRLSLHDATISGLDLQSPVQLLHVQSGARVTWTIQGNLYGITKACMAEWTCQWSQWSP